MSNPNGPIKKIYVNDDVLIDFNLANAAPDDVADGKTFFGANGTLELGTGQIGASGGGSAELTSETFTSNGTYYAAAGTGWNSVSIEVAPTLQSRSVAPTTQEQNISYSGGYDGLETVSIGAIITDTKKTTTNGTVYADPGTYLTSVEVEVPTGEDISDATATGGDIRAGATAYTADGKTSGSIPDYNGELANPMLRSGTMNIEMTDKNGVILATSGTYCPDNIKIVPNLTPLNVTPTANRQEFTATGYVGYSEVVVEAIEESNVTAEPITVTPQTAPQTITPKNTNYFSQVNVEAIPSTYVQPTGNYTVTQPLQGETDISNYATLTVDIPLTELTVDFNGLYTSTAAGSPGFSSVKVETPHYVLGSNSQKINSEEAMLTLLSNPPSDLYSGAARVYQYTGPSGTYNHGQFYVLEVKT